MPRIHCPGARHPGALETGYDGREFRPLVFPGARYIIRSEFGKYVTELSSASS